MAEAKVLVFRVAGQEFGVDIRDVREVIPTPQMTSLPKADAPVVGVFNLRGSIVTAVDGAQALGVGDAASERLRAVVADLGAHPVGLLVDAVTGVLTVAEDEIRAAPELAPASGEGLARGVVLHGERAIVILDLDRLIPNEAATAAGGEWVAP